MPVLSLVQPKICKTTLTKGAHMITKIVLAFSIITILGPMGTYP